MESTWLNESTPEEQRLRLAIAEIRARRAAGDLLSDEEAAAAYPQLAPRLAAELRKLAIVQQARRSAHYSEQCRAAPGHAGAPLAANAIPGYELRGEIHRGSQGVVYLATHCSTGREVAIKVMKHGPFADAFDRLRFEREVRVLGALKHPNIVSIYDSGIALGHSYFVMDYIAGRPLDAYVEQSGRDVPAILRLFTKVCDAVSAAHICGVIHRDLKPGNIRIDDRGEPHILDFGLAKLDDVNVLNGAASPRRAAPADVPPDAFTQTGQFVGSLPWASPEQAEGVGANIDIRTDVYSLGVVLYQALTGRFPYAISGALRTVLDTIQSAPPRPPSQVRREINDEVETIVLKCLQKDRARRYQSAADLSQDLQRYLRGEPIDAKRDSRLYLLRKQFRRNRISVLAALSVFISLIAGIIATTRSTNRALQAEADALALARAESRLREQAQWEAYKASLAAADAALSANNAAMAKARLESAPLSHRGWEWRYLNARLDQSLRSYALPSTLAARPVITPDHSRVFAPLTNGEIQSIDPSTGEMRQFASIGSPDITTLAISADGTRLAVGMRDGAVRLLDAFSSRELLRFRSQHAGPISAIAFAPNGSAIVTGGGDDDQSADSIRLWNASTGQQLIDFGVPSSWVNYLAFDPSGRVLASGHTKAPPGFRLWDTATGEELKFVDYEGLDVFQVEFSPDGRCFAVASQDSAIRIYDLSGELRQTLNAHIAGVGHIAFSRDGTRLLSASADQTLRIWDVASGSATACLRGHLTPASYVTFIGDESRVLSAAYNEPSMKVWQATTSNEPATFETGKYFVLFVEFTPDGSRIFTHQRSWDSATLEPLASLAPRGEWAWNSWVTADPAFEWVGRKSPDLSGAILRNGVPLGTIDEAMSMRPVVSPDHRLIAIALRAGPVRIWRVSDGALQSTLAVDMPLTGVCFARDGSAIITWANGGRWCIFDALSGREALRGNHGTEQIVNATFSADGRLFATASYDGAARICETATGSLLHVLRPTGAPAGDQSVVWSVAFSPDGTRLATGSKDRRLRLWDVATGAELISLGRHAGTVMCISWSPDGSQIATGGFDGTVCLWDSVSRSDRARSD